MDILPIFSTLTQKVSTTLDIIQYIVNFIESRLEIDNFIADNFNKKKSLMELWIDRLIELIFTWNIESEKKLIITIDAVDQLYEDEDRNLLRFLPPNLSGKVQIVFSCLDTFKIKDHNIPIVKIPPLNENDKENVINGILKIYGQRSIGTPVINAIKAKNSSDNPLYLSLLVHRLIMMNRLDFDELNFSPPIEAGDS